MTSGIFESGGFLSASEGTRDSFERTTLDKALDGRPWRTAGGTWTANGTKLSVTEARGTDPKLIIGPLAFSDFDMAADIGLGDAFYVRYVDGSNWLRITHHMDYATSDYACNPYACNPYACNPYACNPYACNPYSCNPYACNPYACNPYSCNCRDTYATGTNTSSQHGCTYDGVYAYPASCSGPCDSCCYPGCASGSTDTNQYSCYFTSGTCTKYTGQVCDTCYSTCYQTCFSTCYDTCYSTCYQTCYSTCYQTCTDYLYPTGIRLEKFVAGALTLVANVNLGTHYVGNANADRRASRMRVVGKGQNIQVFTNHNIAASPVINANVAEHQFARTYGVGRHGYGNQDSGSAVMDNLTLSSAS